VFRGDDGLDELTTTTTSSVWVATGGEVTAAVIDPRAFGITPVQPEALRGGDAAFNADVVREVLAGRGGGARDAVLLNAAAAIAAYDGLSPDAVEDALATALTEASESIASGAAAATLDAWIETSRRLKS